MLDCNVAGEVRLILRLPPEMHAELKEIATRADRSLNRQIVRALREWLAQRADQTGDGPAA